MVSLHQPLYYFQEYQRGYIFAFNILISCNAFAAQAFASAALLVSARPIACDPLAATKTIQRNWLGTGF
jgi:hypothetical protein